MSVPQKIQEALDADLKDMIMWSRLLNLFSDYQTKLSRPEKILIYEKCECFRNFWNEDREVVYPYRRNSGEIVNQIQHVKGLNIDKKSVNPDNIYKDKDILDYYQTETQTRTLDNPTLKNNNNKPATDSSRDTDSIGEAPALAI